MTTAPEEANSILPFWNLRSEEISKQIWNPENYNDVIHTKTLYKTETTHPFFENHYIKNDNLNTELQSVVITRKIRFYPTKEQKSYFKSYFSAHRYFYNKTVEKINNLYDKKKEEFESKPTCIFCSNPKQQTDKGLSFTCESHKRKSIPWNLNISFMTLRNELVKPKNKLASDELWQADIPCHTKQLAVKDAVTAYKSAVTNKLRGHIKRFRLNFIYKKKPTNIFWITPTSISIDKNKNVSLFSYTLNEHSTIHITKKQKGKVPATNTSAGKVLYDRGAWYLVLTIEDNVLEKNICKNLHTIALDPGVRTFQTGYSPNGFVYKFGENQLDELKKIHNRIDKLKSTMNSKECKYKTRYRIKIRLAKLEFKIRNLMNNLHNQVGSFLSRNYKCVLLPKFQTSGMQQSDNIHSITKRRMNGLAHFKFQQKLDFLCKKYGSELRIVDESYTSKTCGSCGNIKSDLGSNRHYDCSICGYSLDRDVHGARNIWIKTYSFN